MARMQNVADDCVMMHLWSWMAVWPWVDLHLIVCDFENLGWLMKVESDLYQICNFRNMLLVPRNLSAIFRSRSKLLYRDRGTTGPCPDEMSSQRIYPLMRWTGPPLMRCPHPLMSGSPPWEKVTIRLYLRHVDDIIHYPDKGKSHRIL